MGVMTFLMLKKGGGSLCFEVRKRGIMSFSFTLFAKFEGRKKLKEKFEDRNLIKT